MTPEKTDEIIKLLDKIDHTLFAGFVVVLILMMMGVLKK